jgi:hypothetical protein
LPGFPTVMATSGQLLLLHIALPIRASLINMSRGHLEKTTQRAEIKQVTLQTPRS